MPAFQKKPHENKQLGFTLLELMIAMSLMLVVVVGVQMFTSGVVIDQQSIREDRSQATQTRIVLTNIQRDIAQSGFYPFFDDPSLTLFTKAERDSLGASIQACPAGTRDCVGQVLHVRTIQAKATAVDCNGSSAQFVNINKNWVLVDNQYSLVKDSNQNVLKCEGNGGNNGRQPHLSHVVSMDWRVVSNANLGLSNSIAAPANRIVSLCIITLENLATTSIASATTDCAGSALAAAESGKAYVKTRIDMPVYAESFTAGRS